MTAQLNFGSLNYSNIRLATVINWQRYQGNGRRKSAARHDAVGRALRCSVQLPDSSVISDINKSAIAHMDFTADCDDSPTNVHNEPISTGDVCTGTFPLWCSLIRPICRLAVTSGTGAGKLCVKW